MEQTPTTASDSATPPEKLKLPLRVKEFDSHYCDVMYADGHLLVPDVTKEEAEYIVKAVNEAGTIATLQAEVAALKLLHDRAPELLQAAREVVEWYFDDEIDIPMGIYNDEMSNRMKALESIIGDILKKEQ